MSARRVIAWALVAATLSSGCTRWQVVGHDTLTSRPESLTWETLRVREARRTSTVRAYRVAWPWLDGETRDGSAPVRIDLRAASRVERRVPDHLWNAIWVGAVYGLVTAFSYLAWVRDP